MGLMVIYAILVACYLSTEAKQIPRVGPYTIIIRERSKCFDFGTNDIAASEGLLSKISRTTAHVSMRITSNLTIDENMELRFNAAIWGNGGWKRNSITGNVGKLCAVLKTQYKSWWDEVMPAFKEQLNVTDCPIPGPFTVLITTTMNSERFAGVTKVVPQLPYGRYLIEVEFILDGQIRGCWAVIGDVAPKA